MPVIVALALVSNLATFCSCYCDDTQIVQHANVANHTVHIQDRNSLPEASLQQVAMHQCTAQHSMLL